LKRQQNRKAEQHERQQEQQPLAHARKGKPRPPQNHR
jgi:hypothetical protein